MAIDLAMALVRGQYQVPARRGRKVTFAYPEGQLRKGVIVAAVDGMVVVDFGDGAPMHLNPEWHLTYHLEPGEVWS